MHAAGPAEVAAELLLEDSGPTLVRRACRAEDGFEDSEATVQVPSERRTGLDHLAWEG